MPETEYDRVPYKSNPYNATHPDQLAVMARVMGMNSPPVQTCRYLELGCGAGGNLLPIAAMMPEARFVGVDLAPTSIQHAREVAEELGLKNIEFHAMSIADVDEKFGKFDYIASHGVFSWVPAPVRDAILRVCRENLVDNGVAYVSYNCFPGWGLRGVVREMMVYHVRDWSEPEEKTSQARAILEFLATSTSEGGEWGRLLKNELERMKELSDWYIYHDNLSPINQAFWFHEFAALIEQNKLEYLGDSMFSTMMLDNFPQTVKDVLAGLQGELVRTEQYLDFVRCRYFRQSLIVHDGAPVNRRIESNRVLDLRFTTRAMPTGPVDFTKGVVATFKSPDGLEVTSDNPLVKAALVEIYESRPDALHFDELLARARKRSGDTATTDEALAKARGTLSSNLLSCFATSVVVPHVWRAPTSTVVPQRPVVFPYARYQAMNGMQTLTNLRHEGAKVDTFERIMAIACDGTRDRDGIVQFLMDAIDTDQLKVRTDDGFKSAADLQRELGPAVDAGMVAMMRLALIVESGA
jgi:methyltransferase-like protein/2-polyprenyl-3-methyl-5-hydroxy-6-metoxy-1,4-benzoquinol methylase